MANVNYVVDDYTKNLLNKVTEQINDNNKKLGVNMANVASQNTIYPTNNVPINGSNQFNSTTFTIGNGTNNLQGTWGALQPHPYPAEDLDPSPKIDMENPIYKNEFEESGVVTVEEKGVLDMYGNQKVQTVTIGLIDEVSGDAEDLYAKFPDGEIIPFKGHQERISMEFHTWNDLKRSDLVGSEIKKAATCNIYIGDRLARIIEGTDIQDLLMKADRAIDELKAQPFSICRDGGTLVGREIYYDNQPAIIRAIDENNNFIEIVLDARYINQFNPPVHAIENGEAEEWITRFGLGMLVRDYDPKIWWWRNSNGVGVDLSQDPFYGQFAQPVQRPLVIPVAPQSGYTKYETVPNTHPYTFQIPLNNPYTITIPPSNPNTIYTYDNNKWSITDEYYSSLTSISPIQPMSNTTHTTPRDLDAAIKDSISYAVDDLKPNSIEDEE